MKAERILFLVSIVLISFLYGFVANRFDLFPAKYINVAIDQGKAVFSEQAHHLYPIVYRRSGARTIDADAVQAGVTLLTSYWPESDWRAGIKLIDSEGTSLHHWNTDPVEIWPERVSSGVSGRYVHGSYLFPDGDVLFNIEYQGLVRMDSCGKVVWKLDNRTHHSIDRDEDGNFWVPSIVTTEDDLELEYLEHFPGLSGPIHEDHILKVSPDGVILKNINMLKVIYDNKLERYLSKISKRNSEDLFHLNDVEVLSTKLAREYPLFRAGDIVVSLKFLHLVLVMNPDTELVKWHATDPFIEQHDPDFTGGGWITLFDNNSDYTSRGVMLGGSRIVALSPHTGREKVLYPSYQSEPFYTEAGGKWQLMDNGNMLVTEARTGRVFETTTSGKTVWEWVHQRYNDELVAEVLEGTRYPYTPAQIAAWSCTPDRRH